MIQRILMPIDGSDCSDHAVGYGLDLAKALGAEVLFLHAFEYPPSIYPEVTIYIPELESEFRAQAESLTQDACVRANEAGIACERRVLEGVRPVQAILQAEKDVDLIVMGTHGRRGFNRWAFGSVAEEVVRRATRPCLLVRRNPNAQEPDTETVVTSESDAALDEALEGTFPASDPVAVHSARSTHHEQVGEEGTDGDP